LQQEGGHGKKVIVTLRQQMENNGYKREGKNYKHEESRFVMKLYFIEVLSRDWNVITFHPLHVYLGCHHQSFLSSFPQFQQTPKISNWQGMDMFYL